MRPRAILARWLEPFAAALWIFFLGATLVVAAIWALRIGDGSLSGIIGNPDLRAALTWLIGISDSAWIALAAATIYLSLAATEGLPTARRWGLIVGGGAAALGAASTLTGIPFGPIQYSAQLGMKLGPVPLGLPLLWFAFLTGSRETALRLFPRASHGQIALATGALTLLCDVNLEPLATQLRGFWFWRAASPSLPPLFDPPPLNYAGWFLGATALSFALREDGVGFDARSRPWRPVAIFAILNAVFLVAHASRLLRG